MRPRFLTVLVIGLLALVGSNAWAQSQGTSDTSESKEKLKEMAGQGESLVDEDIDSMSGQQKLDRGEQKISESRKGLEETNTLLEKAREDEQDIQKINCINDKLAAIKGFLKVAEQSYVKLKDAVKKDDLEEANHHYTLISVSKQKIDRLREEARLCAGEVERYAEGTEVDVDVNDDVEDSDDDGDVPDDRRTGGDLPPMSEVEGLPELTPYK